MPAGIGTNDWHERKIREWLLLLLRFAVTHEQSDQCAVLAMAEELDSIGRCCGSGGPTFFRRTSQQLCRAILAAGDGPIEPVLRKHIARIHLPRLRRAFEAALGVESPAQSSASSERRKRRKDQDFWRGLPSR
jgi:hypothetical protein